MAQPLFGIIALKVDGYTYNVKGNCTYNLGTDKREAVVGADGPHGYKVMPQSPYIEGEFSDTEEISLQALTRVTNSTVTLELRNGKVIVIRNAAFTGDGTANSEEGNIAFRFDGRSGEEI